MSVSILIEAAFDILISSFSGIRRAFNPVGVFLLLACQDIIDFSMILKLLFPIVLVIIGLSLLIKNPFKGNKMKKGKENLDEYAATFGVQNIKF